MERHAVTPWASKPGSEGFFESAVHSSFCVKLLWGGYGACRTMVRRLGCDPQKLTVHTPCPVPLPICLFRKDYGIDRGGQGRTGGKERVANEAQYQTLPLLQILRVYVGHGR